MRSHGYLLRWFSAASRSCSPFDSVYSSFASLHKQPHDGSYLEALLFQSVLSYITSGDSLGEDTLFSSNAVHTQNRTIGRNTNERNAPQLATTPCPAWYIENVRICHSHVKRVRESLDFSLRNTEKEIFSRLRAHTLTSQSGEPDRFVRVAWYLNTVVNSRWVVVSGTSTVRSGLSPAIK
jgi:hypothetical protein